MPSEERKHPKPTPTGKMRVKAKRLVSKFKLSDDRYAILDADALLTAFVSFYDTLHGIKYDDIAGRDKKALSSELLFAYGKSEHQILIRKLEKKYQPKNKTVCVRRLKQTPDGGITVYYVVLPVTVPHLQNYQRYSALLLCQLPLPMPYLLPLQPTMQEKTK